MYTDGDCQALISESSLRVESRPVACEGLIIMWGGRPLEHTTSEGQWIDETDQKHKWLHKKSFASDTTNSP